MTSQTTSCIYEGTIRHRRAEPHREFKHRIALAYLDLDELPSLLGGMLLARGPGPLRFRRADYLRPTSAPLQTAVRERVLDLCGERPPGPIRLLTQLRSFGVCFNPVSFYYCMHADGERVHSVLADVTNTPWGERHSYLIAERAGHPQVLRARFEKQLHVSPFMGMDHVYEARVTEPGAILSVHIDSSSHGESSFDATLALRRHELTRTSAARLAARWPAASLRVLALIYGHAVGLRLAGVRVHPHPRSVAG